MLGMWLLLPDFDLSSSSAGHFRVNVYFDVHVSIAVRMECLRTVYMAFKVGNTGHLIEPRCRTRNCCYVLFLKESVVAFNLTALRNEFIPF
jgi:hypothetical protein